MKFLRFVAVVMLLIGAGALPSARAQAPNAAPADAMQAANELLSVMSKDMLQQMTSQMTAQIWPIIEGKLAGHVDRAALDQLRGEFERIQMENLAEVMKGAPAIYARHFSADELHQLAGFYRTPIGQKALKEMPAVMAESIAMIMPRMPEIQAHTEEAFGKVLRERGYIK